MALITSDGRAAPRAAASDRRRKPRAADGEHQADLDAVVGDQTWASTSERPRRSPCARIRGSPSSRTSSCGSSNCTNEVTQAETSSARSMATEVDAVLLANQEYPMNAYTNIAGWRCLRRSGQRCSMAGRVAVIGVVEEEPCARRSQQQPEHAPVADELTEPQPADPGRHVCGLRRSTPSENCCRS